MVTRRGRQVKRTLVTADVSDPLKVTVEVAHRLLPDSICELGPSIEEPDFPRPERPAAPD